VEAISVTVTNQDVTGVGNVNPVGKASDFLAANATLELSSFTEDGNAVPFEVADVEIISCEHIHVVIARHYTKNP
jgi:hypothetical protein